MDAVSCRLLPYAVADGRHNMAADETMLESAERGVASLRLYGWSEATLSLGYFQPERLRHTDPLLARLPYVRRPTGGATLVHEHELTYALTLPAGPPWQVRGEPVVSWLGRLHSILSAALCRLGVPSRAWPEPKDRSFEGVLCFEDLTPGDLVLGSDKVVGSAQRRRHGALLQHGAVLLAASPSAPCLRGIRELTGRNLTAAEVADAVCEEWPRRTGWRLIPGQWTPAERRRVDDLADQKYNQPGWSRKR